MAAASMALGKRSQARLLAAQALCLFDALGDGFAEQLDDFLQDPEVHADLGLKRRPGPQTIQFARQLAVGAWQMRARSDELLAQAAPDWSISRMPPVDRNILRLGLYELLEMPETPPEVAINEAVELARLLGGTESPAFVNAVLDAIRRRLGIPVQGKD